MKYLWGSHLYKTADQFSDKDWVIIDEEKVSDTVNDHYYTKDEFIKKLEYHDIQALEILFYYNLDYPFVLDKTKLRESISTICSNSWVKGKKKLIVSGDYDLRAAIKSIFHSIRILDYGIQIAEFGKITKWDSYNWMYDDLKKMSLSYNTNELWEKIDNKYRKLFNERRSLFKSMAPKSLDNNLKRIQLTDVLKKHNITNSQLLEDLLQIM